MRGVIRLDGPTDHGGKVISASAHSTVMGLAVARVGDKCTCHRSGHSNCVIVDGDPNVVIDGVPVAFHGHKTSCGAALISTVADSGTA